MANDINKCFFTGRLTRNPELRNTPNGKSIVGFGLATNRSWKGNDDQWMEKVTFLEVQAWNGTGTRIAQDFHKGDFVHLEASYETNDWTDNEGLKHSRPQFTVLNLKKLSASKNGNGETVTQYSTTEQSTQNIPTETKKRGRPKKEEKNPESITPPLSPSLEVDKDLDIPF